MRTYEQTKHDLTIQMRAYPKAASMEMDYSDDGLEHNYTDFSMKVLKISRHDGKLFESSAFSHAYMFGHERFVCDDVSQATE